MKNIRNCLEFKEKTLKMLFLSTERFFLILIGIKTEKFAPYIVNDTMSILSTTSFGIKRASTGLNWRPGWPLGAIHTCPAGA